MICKKYFLFKDYMHTALRILNKRLNVASLNYISIDTPGINRTKIGIYLNVSNFRDI